MIALYIAIGALLLIAAVLLIGSYICFRMVFLRKEDRSAPNDKENIPIPDGKEYEPFRDRMRAKIREARELPYEAVEIKTKDGLTLRGKYYEAHPGAPIELMLHGYRGCYERDLSAGIFRAHRLGRNALLYDHRASGTSEGKVITFGALEKDDCLLWVDYMISKFGDDVKIILTGISMGAATVMLASCEKLPKNVIGVLADCGYTTAEDIIKKVIRDMRLPADLLFPLVRLGARLWGGFDISLADATSALKKTSLPVIFYHGDADGFVPCEMSRINYEACASQKKKLVVIPGADHGLCYMVEPELYERELAEFFSEATAEK